MEETQTLNPNPYTLNPNPRNPDLKPLTSCPEGPSVVLHSFTLTHLGFRVLRFGMLRYISECHVGDVRACLPG